MAGAESRGISDTASGQKWGNFTFSVEWKVITTARCFHVSVDPSRIPPCARSPVGTLIAGSNFFQVQLHLSGLKP